MKVEMKAEMKEKNINLIKKTFKLILQYNTI